MANILVACEFSGTIREAFGKLGHYVMSVDLLPTTRDCSKNTIHNICDIKEILQDNRPHWDLLIGHPPCTYITNAGVRHLYDHIISKNGIKTRVHVKERWQAMEKACEFFNYLKNQKIDKICIENPIPHKYAKTLIGNYTQLIQPWMFGHQESKSTCLWLKNLPKLVETNNVKKEMDKLPNKEKYKVHYASPGKDRWKFRSITYQGIADAMVKQWNHLL